MCAGMADEEGFKKFKRRQTPMRNLKKVLALVLALVMAMSLMVTAGATSLGDYKDSASVSPEYATAVDVATQLGILEGVGNNTYAPQGNLTRAQLATITYRIATGDVTDVYTDNFAGGAAASFTDTPADAWYAGYVGYAADAGYLKGVGEGLYKPNSALTGYQTLAALLRVIGYNQPGQFTGPDWTVQVAQIATETGILNGLKNVDLNGPITREATALLIYNALFSDIVSYTPAFGYQNDKKADDLATDVFGIVTDKAGVIENIDDWGRPGTVWKNAKNEQIVVIAAEAVNTHVVATSQCEIATDLGLKKTADVSTYTNGVAGTLSINPTVTTAIKGSAQGTLVEVYQIGDFNRLVIIDTYLALVTKVNEATYDAAGHLIKDAYSEITVYGLKGIGSGTLDNTSYAKDTYILVNYNEATKKFEDVQAADSFVGAQTKIWTNAAQHTIDGTEYDDAAHFYLDAAGKTKTENFTWFLDQYGNVIGNVAIDRTSYAVLKDIIWNTGKPGYAEATLVDFNGKETTVTVNSFDGLAKDVAANDWPQLYTKNGWATQGRNDAEPWMADAVRLFPGVSTDSKYNDIYEGYALYQVTTLDDGTVILNKEIRDADGKDVATVGYDANANLDNNSSVILGLGNQKIYVNDNTKFLVRNSDNTYSTYTRSTLPELAQNTEIFYVTGSDNIADLVYVKNGVLEAELGHHLYVTTNNYYQIAGTDDYYMNVVIDGVERTVAIDKETTVKNLANNVGKVFHIDWKLCPYDKFYGFVEEAYLVNEAKDGGAEEIFKGDNCDYLSGDIVYSGNTLICDEKSYTVDNDTVIVGNNGVIDTDKGIWVIPGDFKTTHADIVYVGTKLDKSVALTVTAEDGTVTVDPTDVTKITVTSVKDDTNDVLTYTANDANSVVIAPSKTDLQSVTESVYDNNPSRQVIVWNEAGTASETYTVALTWVKSSADASLKQVLVDGTSVPLAAGRTDAKNCDPVYLDKNGEFTLTAIANDSNATVKVGSGTTVELALGNLLNSNSVTVTDSTALNGGVVVIEVIAENGTVQHYVYSTEAAPAKE